MVKGMTFGKVAIRSSKKHLSKIMSMANLSTELATYNDGTKANYTTREIVPQFKGGLQAFGNYPAKNVQYPVDARQNNMQGRVIISFVVEKDGSIGDAKVAKSVYPSMDEEALRAIKNCPKWVPGFRFGRPVRVAYSVPISLAKCEQILRPRAII